MPLMVRVLHLPLVSRYSMLIETLRSATTTSPRFGNLGPPVLPGHLEVEITRGLAGLLEVNAIIKLMAVAAAGPPGKPALPDDVQPASARNPSELRVPCRSYQIEMRPPAKGAFCLSYRIP